MEKSDYLDHVILETLNILHQSENGLRYGDLKIKLNVSDTSLINRLNKLKNSEFITSKAYITDTGKNYFAYTLTDFGIQLVKELDIVKLINKVEKFYEGLVEQEKEIEDISKNKNTDEDKEVINLMKDVFKDYFGDHKDG